MNKNVKRIFFIITLLLLLVSISAISATDASNDTSSLTQQDVVKEDNVEKVSDNTITDTTSKNIKKEETTTDLYVSDTSGSDDNNGTNDNPYKTIQKALDVTNADSTFNIYIAEGTYKGLGNTNLTVNGNYTINIIGDGINKTVLDGEANYTISSGGTAWGTDSYWNPYTYNSGNWGLTITPGIGQIMINGLNLQHMISPGGRAIDLYEHATIDNYANLEVNQVYFYRNLAGVGAGIRNNGNSTLIVNNSIFKENRKANSTGNYGAGIYNNGTAIVENSQFIDNAARWGTVTNDYLMNITNCTFKGGISYDLGSTYKFGSGITSNTASSDYGNPYKQYSLSTKVINSTFIDNNQTDIYQGEGNLYVDNCKFINSTGIYLEKNANNTLQHIITNSLFQDLKGSTLKGSLSEKSTEILGIYDEGSTGIIIENNTLNYTGNGYGINVKDNATIKNNNISHRIVIRGDNNNVTKNIINTQTNYAIEIGGRNNLVDNNTINSYMLTGNKAINSKYSSNTLTNNLPERGQNILLTDDNYNNYFDENGVIKTDSVENYSIITLDSNLYNKNMSFDNIRLSIRNPDQYIIYNGSIELKNNSYTLLEDININNTNDNEYVLLVNAAYTTITNPKIVVNTTKSIKTVILKSDNVTLNNIDITTYGMSNNDTISLLIESSNNHISGNVRTYASNYEDNGNIIGIYLNNSHYNQLGNEFPISVVSEGENVIGMKLNKSNENIIKLRYLINSTEQVTVMDVEASNGNKIFLMADKINVQVSVESPNIYVLNEQNSNNNEFNMNDFIIKGVNVTGIISSNSNNTTITTDTSGSNFEIKASNIRSLYLSNNTGTNVKYMMFKNTPLNTNDKNITSIYIENSNNISLTNLKELINDNGKIIGTFLVLNNTNNTKFSSGLLNKNMIRDNSLIILENSNNNTITKLQINSQVSEIIRLENSNNNNISDNYLNYHNQKGGNETITLINSSSNILENNTPTIIYLTEENYEEYFTDNILTEDAYQINLASNLYNKDMIFPKNIEIKNTGNYIIYNSTFNGKEIILSNMLLNSTNDKTTLIYGTTISLNNSKIYHENTKDIIQTIKSTEITSLTNTEVISMGKEKQGEYTLVIDTNQVQIINSTITLKSNNDEKGTIMLIKNKNSTINDITNSQFFIKANNKVIGFDYANYFDNNNITISAKDITAINNLLWISSRNNFNISGEKIIVINLDSYNKQIYGNNINLNADDSIAIRINNSLPTRPSDCIDIYENNITIKNGSAINISNSKQIQINRNNNMTSENNGSLINIINSTDINITSNHLSSQDLKGNYAINLINSTNINIITNTPFAIITNENYDEYFTNNLLNNPLNDAIEIGSDLYNKNMTFNNPIIINNPNNFTIYNSTIYIRENSSATINNLIIYNTDDRTTSIKTDGIIEIYNTTIIQENKNNTAIVIDVNSNKTQQMSYNNITLLGNGTIINILKAPALIRYNDLRATGDNINAINASNKTGTTALNINTNNIILESNYPTIAIIINNGKSITLIQRNTVIVKAYNKNTPIINSINGTGIQISNNYLESYDTYGDNAVQYTGKATVRTNTPTTTGYKSQINNILLPNNIILNKENEINITVTDTFEREITGTITITDGEITSSGDTQTITYKPTTTGQKTLTITYTDPTGKYDTTNTTVNVIVTSPTLTVDPITATIGETINITARITSNDKTIQDINKGKVTFKVNGKTLKDTNGKVIYAKVVNGTATIENYVVPTDWTKEGTTIQAVYSGSTDCEKLTSEKTNITIIADEPTLTTEDITASTGDKITLKATITDNNKEINTGKIVFKINGKTVKDENGKVIYAKVVNNTVEFEYTLPESMKTSTYNITATLISSDYDRLTDSKTLTITA